ncbi:MAG: RraA family protein [Rhodospirillaceae bacterium]
MSATRISDVRLNCPRVTSDMVSEAATLPAAILADVYGRRGTLSGRIAALSPTMRVAGPALTVEVRPGDNLMIHAALSIAKPGDVIVVDGKGDQTCALIGEIMVSQAIAIGIAGMVLDGAVRDVQALRAKNFPIFSFGYNPCGPTKRIPGRVNHPISVGGVAVNPGDLVVGDADGVVVIERERVAEVIELGRKKVADERKRLDGIARREQLTPAWLAAALEEAGVTMEKDAK